MSRNYKVLLNIILMSIICSCNNYDKSALSISDITIEAKVLTSDYSPVRNKPVDICINSQNSLISPLVPIDLHFNHCNTYQTDSEGNVQINYYGEFPISSYNPFSNNLTELLIEQSMYLEEGQKRYHPIDAGVFEGHETLTTVEGINYVDVYQGGVETDNLNITLTGEVVELEQSIVTDNPNDRGIVMNAKVIFLLSDEHIEQADHTVFIECTDEDDEIPRYCSFNTEERYSDFGVSVWDTDRFSGELRDFYAPDDSNYKSYISIYSEAYSQ